MNSFLDILEKRRSIYGLDKNISISPERIQQIAECAVKHTPSAFNSQSARIVILFNMRHKFLWDTAKDILKKNIPAEAFSKTEQKLDAFQAAAGTILFFDDISIVSNLQNKFPLYKENFPIWSQQSNGMLQSNIWIALAAEGVGASLQHYNPLIDDAIKTEFNIDKNWNLIAQMPFGNPISLPSEKEFISIAERVRVFN